MQSVPITLWFSSIGIGDGQDMATRGYLRSLLAVNYKYIVLNERAGKVTHLDREDLAEFQDLFNYPKHLRKESVRIRAGDRRIGKPWPHLPKAAPVEGPPGAPVGAVGVVWENIIQEGEIDQDYYRKHPEARQLEWEPVTELLVAHFDPGQLARARDALARQSGGQTPIRRYHRVGDRQNTDGYCATAFRLGHAHRAIGAHTYCDTKLWT